MTDGITRMEKSWLASSVPENFSFAMFKEPKPLRRSATITGALAELAFGRYQALGGAWVEHDRAVWIGMIVSDVAGDGGRLLAALRKACFQSNLFMAGTPVPLKPQDWDPARPFHYDATKLIYWYMRQGFRVIQDGSNTRVLLVPRSSTLRAEFSVNCPETSTDENTAVR